jgi:hypothetical protein
MVVALISAGHLQMILDLKRRIGCSVTSAASSWRVAQIEKAAGFSPRLAIFRQIAAGLAHQPNGRRRNALARCATKLLNRDEDHMPILLWLIGIPIPSGERHDALLSSRLHVPHRPGH